MAMTAMVLLSACGSDDQLIVAPEPPNPTTTAPEIISPALAAAGEPTTTTTEPEPVTTTTEAPMPTIPRRTTTTQAPNLQPQTTTGSGACGGSLPPCYVMARESGGDIHVYNYSGSGASGKWQFMPGTWNGYGGYANAADAPEYIQDAKARELWDDGRGCSHWSAC